MKRARKDWRVTRLRLPKPRSVEVHWDRFRDSIGVLFVGETGEETKLRLSYEAANALLLLLEKGGDGPLKDEPWPVETKGRWELVPADRIFADKDPPHAS